MKIDKISYQKTYSIGPYLTDRIGLEASLEGHESCGEALLQLKAEADKAHKELNPHLYQESAHMPLPSPLFRTSPGPSVMEIQTEKTDKSRTYTMCIQEAATLEELKEFKLLASNDKELYSAYNQRLKELTNGK